MNRVIRVLFGLFWFELGVIVAFAPWIGPYWSQNFFLAQFPELTPILLNPFLRGAVTGIGLVNILFAVQTMLSRGQKAVASEN